MRKKIATLHEQKEDGSLLVRAFPTTAM